MDSLERSQLFTFLPPFCFLYLQSLQSYLKTTKLQFCFSTSQPESDVSRRRSNRGVYIGSGVAVGLFVLITVMVLLILLKIFVLITAMVLCIMYPFKRRKKQGNSAEEILVEIATIDRNLQVFKFKELKKAAGDFCSRNRIKGSSVYRGVFKGREDDVIKKMSTDASEEVNMLNTINHFNLVKLHGFSVHQGCYYLVFEYMKNGSLREWLKKKIPKKVRELDSVKKSHIEKLQC